MSAGSTMALAGRIAASRYANQSSAALTVARQCLLDFLGVTLAGMREPLTRLLLQDIREAGGNAQASIPLQPAKVALDQAALVNGAAGHAHDYDDVHNGMTGHPTVPVAPVVLALAEYRHASGAELLNAFIAGVDTECILGRALGPSHYARGFHATGTLGSLGAAAAAARLYGLDTEATARALGIAATQAAGLKSQFGTMVKPLHAGHAAQTGLAAARLAHRGFTSRTDMIENSQGLAATQSTTFDADRFGAALAAPAYTPEICFKYHAACYMTHSAIEATRALMQRHQLAAGDVQAVEITVNEGHFGVCTIPAPVTGLEAKFSLRFTAAMAMAGEDTAGIDAYTDELVARPELVALRDRVDVIAWDTPHPETRVRMLVRGDWLEEQCNVGIPMTDLSAQWQRLATKFHALADPVVGRVRADAIEDWCHHLDARADLDPFFSLLRGHA
ncbi:MAG: MmgE/PrpD family protein [Pseudomonadales bacterium]|nr:MmgE/PrpD family protein [Pseudomonadales bacterium]MCP5182665.1 MmgE/PrpD family protein [Pseudomonadales bacterium]